MSERKPGVKLEGIDYASPGIHERSRQRIALGTVGLIIGALCLTICAALVIGDVREKSQLARDEARGGQAYVGEFRQCRELGQHDTVFHTILSILAGLLIVGSAMLLRNDNRGILVQWLYVSLQFVVSVTWAIVLVSDLSDSPAGMIAYFGVIPGAIAAAPPIVVATLLVRSRERRRVA